MGSCFSDADPKRKTANPAIQQDRGKSFDTLNEYNPELLQESPTKQLIPPTSITAPSTVDAESKVRSIISLEEALEKSKIDVGDDEEIQDVQSWIEAHNTTSSIINIPKNKRNTERNKEEPPPKPSMLLSELQDCQGMSGNMQTSRHVSKMVVTSDFVDIEFMLPRSRAGPLVVPYIAYDHYHTNPETQ